MACVHTGPLPGVQKLLKTHGQEAEDKGGCCTCHLPESGGAASWAGQAPGEETRDARMLKVCVPRHRPGQCHVPHKPRYLEARGSVQQALPAGE